MPKRLLQHIQWQKYAECGDGISEKAPARLQMKAHWVGSNRCTYLFTLGASEVLKLVGACSPFHHTDQLSLDGAQISLIPTLLASPFVCLHRQESFQNQQQQLVGSLQ